MAEPWMTAFQTAPPHFSSPNMPTVDLSPRPNGATSSDSTKNWGCTGFDSITVMAPNTRQGANCAHADPLGPGFHYLMGLLTGFLFAIMVTTVIKSIKQSIGG